MALADHISLERPGIISYTTARDLKQRFLVTVENPARKDESSIVALTQCCVVYLASPFQNDTSAGWSPYYTQGITAILNRCKDRYCKNAQNLPYLYRPIIEDKQASALHVGTCSLSKKSSGWETVTSGLLGPGLANTCSLEVSYWHYRRSLPSPVAGLPPLEGNSIGVCIQSSPYRRKRTWLCCTYPVISEGNNTEGNIHRAALYLTMLITVSQLVLLPDYSLGR